MCTLTSNIIKKFKKLLIETYHIDTPRVAQCILPFLKRL